MSRFLILTMINAMIMTVWSFFFSDPPISPLTSLIVLAVTYALTGFHVINEWDRVAVLFFGRYQKTVGPGLVWIDPLFHTALEPELINDCAISYGISGVQSEDNVPLRLDFVLTTRVHEDLRAYTVAVHDAEDAVFQRVHAAVTEVAADRVLDELLHDRAAFSDQVKKLLDRRLAPWGVDVIAVEIQSMSIEDENVLRALALKAQALREGEAEVVRAQKAVEVAKHLQEASEAYSNSPIAMQLRGLEAIAELARSGTNNMVLIPTDIVDALGRLRSVPDTPISTPKTDA